MDAQATEMTPALQSWARELKKETVRRLGTLCLVAGSVELAALPVYVFTDILPLAALGSET